MPLLATIAPATGLVILLIMLLVVAAWSLLWYYDRSRQVLDRWAQRNGCRILRAERRQLFRGPFFWRSSKGQVVFRVIVRHRDGSLREGYVRVGGWLWGLFSDEAMVEWDDRRYKERP